jgi:hypothetical protein
MVGPQIASFIQNFTKRETRAQTLLVAGWRGGKNGYFGAKESTFSYKF